MSPALQASLEALVVDAAGVAGIVLGAIAAVYALRFLFSNGLLTSTVGAGWWARHRK